MEGKSRRYKNTTAKAKQSSGTLYLPYLIVKDRKAGCSWQQEQQAQSPEQTQGMPQWQRALGLASRTPRSAGPDPHVSQPGANSRAVCVCYQHRARSVGSRSLGDRGHDNGNDASSFRVIMGRNLKGHISPERSPPGFFLGRFLSPSSAWAGVVGHPPPGPHVPRGPSGEAFNWFRSCQASYLEDSFPAVTHSPIAVTLPIGEAGREAQKPRLSQQCQVHVPTRPIVTEPGPWFSW